MFLSSVIASKAKQSQEIDQQITTSKHFQLLIMTCHRTGLYYMGTLSKI